MNGSQNQLIYSFVPNFYIHVHSSFNKKSEVRRLNWKDVDGERERESTAGKKIQDRQWTYNVISRRVRATIVAVENQYYVLWACICRLWYLACNAHAPYCHLCPVWLYNTFPHYLINGVVEHKMYVLILYNIIWSISDSKKNSATHYHKTHTGLHVQRPLLSSDFDETLIFSTDFRKILTYQTSWKSVQWERSCSMWTDGRTNGHTHTHTHHTHTYTPHNTQTHTQYTDTHTYTQRQIEGQTWQIL